MSNSAAVVNVLPCRRRGQVVSRYIIYRTIVIIRCVTRYNREHVLRHIIIVITVIKKKTCASLRTSYSHMDCEKRTMKAKTLS